MEKILFVAFIAVLLLAGCVQPEQPANDNGSDVSAEIVEAGDTVKVEYRGELESGDVFDSSESHGSPLEFVAGKGRVIKGFDDAVLGMRLGEEKTVSIPPENGYGFSDPKKVVEIPKENVNVDWNALEVGTPISSQVAGNGVILEKKENSVIVDFNNPLAGKTLIFWIKVVSIVKA